MTGGLLAFIENPGEWRKLVRDEPFRFRIDRQPNEHISCANGSSTWSSPGA